MTPLSPLLAGGPRAGPLPADPAAANVRSQAEGESLRAPQSLELVRPRGARTQWQRAPSRRPWLHT
eukprot:5287397-Alexandrium_andersonii.AAC.1